VCVRLGYININGRDVQRKTVVNNVDMSSLWAPCQNSPYKSTQNILKHGVYKDAADIKKLLFFVFLEFVVGVFLFTMNILLKFLLTFINTDT